LSLHEPFALTVLQLPPGPQYQDMTMFHDFELHTLKTEHGPIRLRHGGSGPPLLLLHGHPRSHMTWGQVADLLSVDFQVICPDLPGFGRSYIPVDDPQSTFSTKRAKAAALADMMHRLGHNSFFVAGHDRGSLVAFRMAMDHPELVRKLITVDGLPVIEHLERVDWQFARDWYHWFFFAQPEMPERAILADPMAWYTLSPDAMGQAAYDDWLASSMTRRSSTVWSKITALVSVSTTSMIARIVTPAEKSPVLCSVFGL
jgi:haloacetate dehalogenase